MLQKSWLSALFLAASFSCSGVGLGAGVGAASVFSFFLVAGSSSLVEYCTSRGGDAIEFGQRCVVGVERLKLRGLRRGQLHPRVQNFELGSGPGAESRTGQPQRFIGLLDVFRPGFESSRGPATNWRRPVAPRAQPAGRHHRT